MGKKIKGRGGGKSKATQEYTPLIHSKDVSFCFLSRQAEYLLFQMSLDPKGVPQLFPQLITAIIPYPHPFMRILSLR